AGTRPSSAQGRCPGRPRAESPCPRPGRTAEASPQGRWAAYVPQGRCGRGNRRSRLPPLEGREDVSGEELELLQVGGERVEKEGLDADPDALFDGLLYLVDGPRQEPGLDIVPGTVVRDHAAHGSLLLGDHVLAAASLDDVAEILLRDHEASGGPGRPLPRQLSVDFREVVTDLVGGGGRARDPAVAGADSAQ